MPLANMKNIKRIHKITEKAGKGLQPRRRSRVAVQEQNEGQLWESFLDSDLYDRNSMSEVSIDDWAALRIGRRLL